MSSVPSPAVSPVLINGDGEISIKHPTKKDLDWMDAQEGGNHYICIEYDGTIVDENGNFNGAMVSRIENLIRGKKNIVIAINEETDISKVSEKMQTRFGKKFQIVKAFDKNMIEFWSERAVPFKNGSVGR